MTINKQLTQQNYKTAKPKQILHNFGKQTKETKKTEAQKYLMLCLRVPMEQGCNLLFRFFLLPFQLLLHLSSGLLSTSLFCYNKIDFLFGCHSFFLPPANTSSGRFSISLQPEKGKQKRQRLGKIKKAEIKEKISQNGSGQRSYFIFGTPPLFLMPQKIKLGTDFPFLRAKRFSDSGKNWSIICRMQNSDGALFFSGQDWSVVFHNMHTSRSHANEASVIHYSYLRILSIASFLYSTSFCLCCNKPYTVFTSCTALCVSRAKMDGEDGKGDVGREAGKP